jgi:hypothetical protein
MSVDQSWTALSCGTDPAKRIPPLLPSINEVSLRILPGRQTAAVERSLTDVRSFFPRHRWGFRRREHARLSEVILIQLRQQPAAWVDEIQDCSSPLGRV